MSQMLEEAPYCLQIQEKLEQEALVQMIMRVGKIEPYGQNAKIRRSIDDYVTVK